MEVDEVGWMVGKGDMDIEGGWTAGGRLSSTKTQAAVLCLQ